MNGKKPGDGEYPMAGKHILSDGSALFAPTYAPPRGLSFMEWRQVIVAARQDARLLTRGRSLSQLLEVGTHPAKARVLCDCYLQTYQITAAARYGTGAAPAVVDLPPLTLEPLRTSQYEDDGAEQSPEHASEA